MISLNYLMGHILYQIFKIILSIFKKKRNEKIANPSARKYVNKTENRIAFKIKTKYYLKLLTSETMKLFASTKNKTNKDNNGEIVPNLEVFEVVLINCIIVNNDYQQDSRVLYTFLSNKSLEIIRDCTNKFHHFRNI